MIEQFKAEMNKEKDDSDIDDDFKDEDDAMVQTQEV